MINVIAFLALIVLVVGLAWVFRLGGPRDHEWRP